MIRSDVIRPIPDELIRQLEERRLAGQGTLKSLCIEFGIAASTVRRYRRRMGMPRVQNNQHTGNRWPDRTIAGDVVDWNTPTRPGQGWDRHGEVLERDRRATVLRLVRDVAA